MLILVLSTADGFTQLSPGDLHKSHAHLEGLKNCSECHGIGQKISSDNCLKCHEMIRERIDSNQGLHAQPGFGECEKCHVEHYGRDFQLIYWESGQENFNHQQTGFTLEGKHLTLKCRNCHQEKFITDKEKFLKAKKDLEKTFLGLRKQCLNCHQDEHRGQLSLDCITCHTHNSWKPAEKFSHEHTGFPLQGKHISLRCEKCHPMLNDKPIADDTSYLKFAGIKYSHCTSCHTDVHKNKFGQDCQKCHTPSGWQNYNMVNFNHSKTNFPLLGKHRSLACEKCHAPNQPLKISQYSQCRDCHSNYHQGQFSSQLSAKDCKACHSEKGFVPVRFSIADHAETRFSLEGAHLATPCNACHQKINLNANNETVKFQFVSIRCIDCHRNPHQISAMQSEFVSQGECGGCHKTESWRIINFDHNQTKFTLEYRHTEIACIACHLPDSNKQILFPGLVDRCSTCHNDPHMGQFAIKNNGQGFVTLCGNCHSPKNWKAEKFDHNRQAAFKLEGAHTKLDCKKCHFTMNKNGITFTQFKPIPHNCADCHDTSKPMKDSLNGT
jgi:hypothetical protein